jgi:hypothetical protein
MKKYIKVILLFAVSIISGCQTYIKDKHLDMMKTHKDKVYYATAAPLLYSNNKSSSYRLTCFTRDKWHAHWAEATPSNHFNAFGGGSSEGLEEYAINECEKKFDRSCVILLLNGTSRCDATFDAAYVRAEVRVEQRRNLVEKKKSEEENRRAEEMKRTCMTFGFSPNTQEISACVMELFKTTAQVEAIRQAAESQSQVTTAVANETARLLKFQQSMELLKQSNQMLNPTNQSRTTTVCRYNTIMKTITCN